VSQVQRSVINPFTNLDMALGYEAWYDGTGRRAHRLEKALLKRLLACFPQAGTLLEVGCGTGHFTRWFDERGLQAAGLDLSQPMLPRPFAWTARRVWLATHWLCRSRATPLTWLP